MTLIFMIKYDFISVDSPDLRYQRSILMIKKVHARFMTLKIENNLEKAQNPKIQFPSEIFSSGKDLPFLALFCLEINIFAGTIHE